MSTETTQIGLPGRHEGLGLPNSLEHPVYGKTVDNQIA